MNVNKKTLARKVISIIRNARKVFHWISGLSGASPFAQLLGVAHPSRSSSLVPPTKVAVPTGDLEANVAIDLVAIVGLVDRQGWEVRGDVDSTVILFLNCVISSFKDRLSLSES